VQAKVIETWIVQPGFESLVQPGKGKTVSRTQIVETIIKNYHAFIYREHGNISLFKNNIRFDKPYVN